MIKNVITYNDILTLIMHFNGFSGIELLYSYRWHMQRQDRIRQQGGDEACHFVRIMNDYYPFRIVKSQMEYVLRMQGIDYKPMSGGDWQKEGF